MSGFPWSRLASATALLVALLACKQLKGLQTEDKKTSGATPARTPTATATATATGAPTAPRGNAQRPPGRVEDITQDAVLSIETSSEKKKQPAKNLFDQDPKTAWVEDSPSDGEGHFVEVKLVPGTYIAFVEVSSGWGSETRFGEDLWELNNSARIMKVTWDSGEAEVSYLRSTDRGKKKKVDINATTDKLRFTAERIAKGKFNDLAIDDVNLYGVIGR